MENDRDTSLQSWEFLTLFLPRHRDFLEALNSKQSARQYVLHLSSNAAVHTLAVLEAEFNGCLDELARYCSRRSQLVCRYLPSYAADFRKHAFDLDKKALLAGRLSVVLQRRLAQGSGDELEDDTSGATATAKLPRAALGDDERAKLQTHFEPRSRADSCASDESSYAPRESPRAPDRALPAS